MSVTAAMNISLDAPWQSDKVKKKEMKDDFRSVLQCMLSPHTEFTRHCSGTGCFVMTICITDN